MMQSSRNEMQHSGSIGTHCDRGPYKSTVRRIVDLRIVCSFRNSRWSSENRLRAQRNKRERWKNNAFFFSTAKFSGFQRDHCNRNNIVAVWQIIFQNRVFKMSVETVVRQLIVSVINGELNLLLARLGKMTRNYFQWKWEHLLATVFWNIPFLLCNSTRFQIKLPPSFSLYFILDTSCHHTWHLTKWSSY